MPGYTHVQPAQPITAGHWLMSFFWMLARDDERLTDARRRMNVSPLGAGPLAGTPFDVDRAALAAALGFDSHSQNSLDAVSDRDFVAETLFALALIGIHLSRLAEDVVIYSNPLFGYITLNDRYSTGSSIMPQKRNADPMELARGKAGRLIGNLTGLLATLKGLPSTYNKDLQEDKEALFDSVDTLTLLAARGHGDHPHAQTEPGQDARRARPRHAGDRLGGLSRQARDAVPRGARRRRARGRAGSGAGRQADRTVARFAARAV